MESHQKRVLLQASGLPYQEETVETNTAHQETKGHFLQYLDSFTIISPISDSFKHDIIPFPQQKFWELPASADQFLLIQAGFLKKSWIRWDITNSCLLGICW